MKKQMTWLFPLLLITLLLCAACGDQDADRDPAAASEPTVGPGEMTVNRAPDTLVVILGANADNLDPAQTFNSENNLVQRGIYEGLLRLKGTSTTEVEGVLAEDWHVSADQRDWQFSIRQGVTFHDGTPCDAPAIAASITRMLANQLPAASILGRFIGYEPAKVMTVVDDYTLKFTFAEPQPLFALGLATAYGTGIISPQAFTEHAQAGDVGKAWLTTHAVGTGPFMLEKFAPNDEIILVRNPTYWRGWDQAEQFTKVIIKSIPEASTRRQIMEQGEADIALPFPNPGDEQALAATGLFDIGTAGQMRIDYALYNPHGKLKDPRTRQALSYAFDYDGYINGIRQGLGRRAAGPFPRNLIYHDPNVFVYPTDLDQAKALFDAAGWNYEDELRFTYYPGFGGENVGPVLQAQLAQIGVKLQVEEQDIASFNGLFYGDQPGADRPDLMWYAWWPNLDDAYDQAWILYHSAAGGAAGANGGFYHNERVDSLIEAASRETDPAKLTQIWQEVQQILTVDDPAGLWVEDPLERTVIRKDITGHTYNAIYASTFDFWALRRTGE